MTVSFLGHLSTNYDIPVTAPRTILRVADARTPGNAFSPLLLKNLSSMAEIILVSHVRPSCQRRLREGSVNELRVVKEALTPRAPCSRCKSAGCPWDRLAGQPVCPDCQEALAQGEGEPFVVRTEKLHCAVCRQAGTVRYLTYPLHSSEPIEIDLCPRHFQALLARRLDRHAYHQLSRQLQTLGFSTRQVFLLHEAFYDEQGHSLQPVPEL
jgi:hypothetical protein